MNFLYRFQSLLYTRITLIKTFERRECPTVLGLKQSIKIPFVVLDDISAVDGQQSLKQMLFYLHLKYLPIF